MLNSYIVSFQRRVKKNAIAWFYAKTNYSVDVVKGFKPYLIKKIEEYIKSDQFLKDYMKSDQFLIDEEKALAYPGKECCMHCKNNKNCSYNKEGVTRMRIKLANKRGPLNSYGIASFHCDYYIEDKELEKTLYPLESCGGGSN